MRNGISDIVLLCCYACVGVAGLGFALMHNSSGAGLIFVLAAAAVVIAA